MKTKLLLIAILFLSFVETTFSQEYHPLLNNPSWVVSDWVSCCRLPYVRTINEGTDAVIGAHTYKKFIDPFPKWSISPSVLLDTIYLREDITERKVYKIVNGEDFLLYDFSLQDGDTFSQYGFNWNVTVDEVAVDGGTRKQFTLNSINLYSGHSLTQKWIEGVGTNAHPFYPDFFMYAVVSGGGGYRVYTRCSFEDGVHVYGNSEYCASALMLNTADETYSDQNIVFSPNPFRTEMTISSGFFLQNATFKLYNIQGQLVREINNLSGQKILVNRENLSDGLYFAQLFEGEKLVKSAKMMVN